MPGHTQPTPGGTAPTLTPEQTEALYAAAQKRNDAENERRNKLMAHWTHAVCIGCGSLPGPFRAVRTNPLRVLAGIPAWQDDERARASGGVTKDAPRRRLAALEGA